MNWSLHFIFPPNSVRKVEEGSQHQLHSDRIPSKMKISAIPSNATSRLRLTILLPQGRAHFCLVPGGTSPWTVHLYESFFAGCVPVILSDEFQVAWQDDLPWPEFSLKYPENGSLEELERILRRLVKTNKVAKMREALNRYRCFFDYFSPRPNCSPWILLQRKLRMRLDSRQQAFGGRGGLFWGPWGVGGGGKTDGGVAGSDAGVPEGRSQDQAEISDLDRWKRPTRYHSTAETNGERSFLLGS